MITVGSMLPIQPQNHGDKRRLYSGLPAVYLDNLELYIRDLLTVNFVLVFPIVATQETRYNQSPVLMAQTWPIKLIIFSIGGSNSIPKGEQVLSSLANHKIRVSLLKLQPTLPSYKMHPPPGYFLVLSRPHSGPSENM